MDKLTLSLARYRQHSLDLINARRKTILLTELPREQHQHVVSNKPKEMCKARTLEGRPCPFKATSGCFCKKHSSMI